MEEEKIMELNALKIEVEGCDTVAKLFRHRAASHGQEIAFREKLFGVWQSFTWNDYFNEASAVSYGLLEMGVQPGEVVSVLSENNKEWFYVDMANVMIRAITNGIYTTDAPEQVHYILEDSKSKVLFLEDDEQLDKVLEVWEKLPLLEKVIVFDPKGLREFKHEKVEFLADFMKRGHELREKWQRKKEELTDVSAPDDLITLIYTSGTTGAPKGAMVDNSNIIFQLQQFDQFAPSDHRDRQISYLPLCHIAEKIFSILAPLKSRSVIYFVDEPDTFVENIAEISPTIFFGVPRIWEKFYSRVTLKINESTFACQQFYRLAHGFGSYLLAKKRKGQKILPPLAWLWGIVDFIAFRNIRSALGVSKMRTAITAAAPIAPELISWLVVTGVPLFEAYGLTECSGIATVNNMGTDKSGSIGKTMERTEIRIADDGEVLLSGAHIFRDYWGKPEKTAETVVDGWLHTGDLGKQDEDGYVWIDGRKKDLIITSGGKNISPGEIETSLKASPFITDAVVIGDGRKYLTSLIMVDGDNVERYAGDRNLPFTDFTSLCQLPEVTELIGQIVANTNKRFSRVEQIKKFRLIDQKLVVEDEELTATMKLKRNVVIRKYKDLINTMYS